MRWLLFISIMGFAEIQLEHEFASEKECVAFVEDLKDEVEITDYRCVPEKN